MRTYPVPFNEDSRVTAVQNVPGLTRDNETLFDAICTAAARLLDCPIAHISVVEENTQWYKSVVGIELEEMPKNNSFCTHTIMTGMPMVVPDLSQDAKFREHPMVAEGGPQARFYAGVPLILSSGFRFGSLCVLDFVPHERPTPKELATLEELGRAIVAALEKAPSQPAAPRDTTAQETFLTLVGHELRTPLTIIHGSVRMLEARLKDETNKKLANSALKSSDHLSKLINAILKFSDVRTGELHLNEEVTDLAPLIAGLHQDHAMAISEAGKTFVAPVCNVQLPLLVDQEHIKICITSLLMNSVLHGGQSLGVAFAYDDNGNIEIRVTDDGQLDNHVDLAELYKPFIVGGDMSQRGSRGGLGLGLPLTRRLVELHGGEFEVITGPEGTTACIRLPKWRRRA
ncbi:histidine kinase dimerization/phospho-acceptor domain-containing protein [Sulfitobacter aestuarii]|uniref:histidine kinase n=1 Tax=Sulfitobacter aestuarii TaxID=2161676 RepID=A0ABW5U551_9RHOB